MWIFVLTIAAVGCCASAQDVCTFLTAQEVPTPWIADTYGRLNFPAYNQEPINAIETELTAYHESSSPCGGNAATNNVICTGRLNETMIKEIEFPVSNLLIVNYNMENGTSPVIPAKYKHNTREQNAVGGALPLSSATYKATGDVYSSGVGIGMTLSSVLRPNNNYDAFIVNGDAFSNELRVGWQIFGELAVMEANGTYVMQAKLQTVGDGGWSFEASCYVLETKTDSWSWTINGTVDSNLLLAPISFEGTLKTSVVQNAYKITGDVIVKPLLIKWQVAASFTSTNNEYVTIENDFFRGLSIKNIYFKDCYFMGDFDRDALQGINEIETITFTNSKLEEIPRLDYLLNNLTTLKAIYIEESSMPNLLMGNVPTLTNLELFSLKGSGPLQLNSDSMSWLAGSNLTYLNLQDCNINVDSASSDGVLEVVSSTLLYLDLSYTSLLKSEALEVMLKGLKISDLSLAGLQLTQVPHKALQQVSDTLRHLTLRRNNFHKKPDENLFSLVLNFPIMLQLEELDLAFCNINYIEAGIFDNLENLKTLILSHNNVDNIQDGWYMKKPQLLHVDLSWNGQTIDRAELSLQPGDGLAHLTQVEIVDFSNAVFIYHDALITSLSKSTRILSLCNNEIKSSSVFNQLQLPALTTLDISGNPDINFGSYEMVDFMYSLQQLQRLYARNNKMTNAFFNFILKLADDRNKTVFMESLTVLDLKGNLIKSLSSSFLVHFPNLQYVDLTGNSIGAWSEPLGLPNLRYLNLSDNKIETMTSAMFHDVLNLNATELGKNPFVCNCDLYKLANSINSGLICKARSPRLAGTFVMRRANDFTWKSRSSCVHLTDWANGTNYYCYNVEDDQNMKDLSSIRKSSELCQAPENSPIADATQDFNALYIGGASLLIFGVVIGFIYWKWWEIRLMTRAVRNAAILSLMDKDDPEEKIIPKYHAFVSYCEKDRPWVLQKMLPRLEQWNGISVCLHERDFQVGVSIMENITSSMDKSRHLVIVLSQSFVLSQWCQFELQLAQHRMIETKRDKLVLILLEPIPYYKKPKTLRYLMRTNTYIEWPGENHNSVEKFWERLLQSIN